MALPEQNYDFVIPIIRKQRKLYKNKMNKYIIKSKFKEKSKNKACVIYFQPKSINHWENNPFVVYWLGVGSGKCWCPSAPIYKCLVLK